MNGLFRNSAARNLDAFLFMDQFLAQSLTLCSKRERGPAAVYKPVLGSPAAFEDMGDQVQNPEKSLQRATILTVALLLSSVTALGQRAGVPGGVVAYQGNPSAENASASTQSKAPEAAAPAAKPAPAASARPASPGDTGEAPPGPSRSDYVIGPGDSLQIFVWRNPELSSIVPVRPDGRISTPLVEDMVAVGKTPAELARDMETVLAEFVRSPTVNVILQNAVGALAQIKVLGQVKAPQSVPYHDGIKVLDVLLISGGLTDFAAGNRATLVRQPPGESKAKNIRVKLGDLIEKHDVSQNIALAPGDILIVPQARW
jgi:polysaccharide export outer membrane protein